MRKYFSLAVVLLMGCSQPDRTFLDIDIQGHRGARGLMPENTIEGFIKALELGVNTLEMDLAVTKDMELVVSHEPWMNHIICQDNLGNEISEENQRAYRIYGMSYSEIIQFDCGLNEHPGYPEQKKIPARKPLLREVISAVQSFTEQQNVAPPAYNIEIKSHPATDSLYHPLPDTFSELVFNTLTGLVPLERVTVQSFDIRVLQYLNQNHPEVRLAYLVGDIPYEIPGVVYPGDKGVAGNIELLGFTPDIYSPNYNLLSPEVIREVQDMGMKVIPWTLNEKGWRGRAGRRAC